MTVSNTVDSLIGQMKSAAKRQDMEAFDRASDELTVLVRAYAEPSLEDNWPTVSLTPKERRIADLLLARLNRVTSYEAIINALWYDRRDGEPETAENAIGVFIFRLRRKLAGTKYRIETIWGTGFRMTECKPGTPITTYTRMAGQTRQPEPA